MKLSDILIETNCMKHINCINCKHSYQVSYQMFILTKQLICLNHLFRGKTNMFVNIQIIHQSIYIQKQKSIS